MLKITFIVVGKLKEKYLKDAVSEYSKRLSRFAKIEFVEIADEKCADNLSPLQEEMVRIKEGERILRAVKENSYVLATAIDGKMYDSMEFAQSLQNLFNGGTSHISFIIGGSLGLSENVYKRADRKISFSKMTFPHQLMRVILLEQVYRGFKILGGEAYHK